MATRSVRDVIRSVPVVEGAGVHLHRAIGLRAPETYDPFLLLDDFRADERDQYIAGFPWHPHRGMETITYVLSGEVEHQDNMGNKGVIGAGDVQWMTAGSGIIHQEMPQGDAGGRMGGFQLWANLPAANKMMGPRYRGLERREIPEARADGGATVKVIAGAVGSVVGPVADVVTKPEYLDVTLPAGATFEHPTAKGHTVFAYVVGGRAIVDGREVGDRQLVHFADGDAVVVKSAGDAPARFLLVSGRPIGEPIAWRGPIVMNTQAELRDAFEELRAGSFIRKQTT